MLTAGVREFSNQIICAKRLRKGGMGLFVVSGKKHVAAPARREHRGGHHMIEIHVAAAPEMPRPGGTRASEQWMEVVYFRRKEVARLVHDSHAKRVTRTDSRTRSLLLRP